GPPGRGRSSAWASSGPLQGFLAPGVVEAGHQDEDEDPHLDDPVPAELAEQHGPGEEEDHLDVEDDEEQREHVEVARVAPPRRADGLFPRLIGPELLRRALLGLDEARRREKEGHKNGSGTEKNENVEVRKVV